MSDLEAQKQRPLMYCPQCATPNGVDVKFCRACGMELESVALALSGKSAARKKGKKDKPEPMTVQEWSEKRIEGVSSFTRGTVLLSVSLILAIPMGLFVPSSFDVPWILLWTVFFGWMAVWGGIELTYGISGVFEADSRLRLLRSEGPNTSDASPTLRSSRGSSITEGTTRKLNS